MIKHTKRLNAFVGAISLLAILCIGVQLHSMKPIKFTLKSRRRGAPVQESRYKSEIVWVKTSDNKLLEVPQWQIDQMKAIQPVSESSKENPAHASMVMSEQLALIQEALQKASNLEEFRRFYGGLSDDQQKSLLADAFTLEMQGLASLLITYMFPLEVQQQMGANILQSAGIIAPVVEYLKVGETLSLSQTGPVHKVALSSDGQRIISAAGGVNNNLILYDVATGTQENLVSDTIVVNDVAFNPDGTYIAVALFNHILLCDGHTGKVIKKLGVDQPYWPACVTFSVDRRYIISGSTISAREKAESNLAVYDVKNFNKVEIFEHVTAPIHSLVCTPDGKYIIAGAARDYVERVIVFDAATGRWARAFKGFIPGKVRVAVNPDSRTVVAGASESDGLVLWDLQTGKDVAVFKGHDGGVRSVAFSLDGKYIASVSSGEQNNVIVWNGTGELIHNIKGIEDAHCVAFSPDGNYLLCGGKAGLISCKVYSPKTLDYIATQLNLAQARFLYRLYLAKKNRPLPKLSNYGILDFY